MTRSARAIPSQVEAPLGDFFDSNLPKPSLVNVTSLGGGEVTRRWPLTELDGGSMDHLHHVGIFFCIDKTNGTNFWNYYRNENGREPKIRHVEFEEVAGGQGHGVIRCVSRWIDKRGEFLLAEKRKMEFVAGEGQYAIDIEIDLTAQKQVVFEDIEEGVLGIRLSDYLREGSRSVDLHDGVDPPGENVKGTGRYFCSSGEVGAGGIEDGALECDGVDDYVSTPFILNPAELPFSVMAWIKGGTPGQAIISQMDNPGGRTVEPGSTWLGTDPSEGRLMTGLMDTFFGPLESDSIITDGQWHHISLVYDRTAMKRHLYVDGEEVAVDPDYVGGAQSIGGLNIGTGQSLDAASFFSGLIDDVRLYNAALSAEDIMTLAN